MKKINFFGILALVFLLSLIAEGQNEDIEGCKDYPAFNRMPGFHIISCKTTEFDSYIFPVENSLNENCKKQAVEGKYYDLSYALNEGAQEPSALHIFRNFENALKQVNATIVAKVIEQGNSYSFITGRFSKGNMETWVYINASGTDYQLYIVEKQNMEQVIQAGDMLKALNSSGFIALNILFDTGKSTIKKESQDIVDQIYEMLRTNNSLKISIEGHTDNTGNIEGNKSLSENRAKAVLDALVGKGIEKSRLSYKGWGQEKPVADNRTDDGKAKNRRVEIVKIN
jgi:OmpA-OmpF porin, OOP family